MSSILNTKKMSWLLGREYQLPVHNKLLLVKTGIKANMALWDPTLEKYTNIRIDKNPNILEQNSAWYRR